MSEKTLIRWEKHYSDGSIEFTDAESASNFEDNLNAASSVLATRSYFKFKPVKWSLKGSIEPIALTQEGFRNLPDEEKTRDWRPLVYINATPDEGYVLRILEAELDNAQTGRFEGTGDFPKLLNEAQEKRAELLKQAIEKLTKK